MTVTPRIRALLFIAFMPISFVFMAMWGAALGIGDGVEVFRSDLREAIRLLRGGEP